METKGYRLKEIIKTRRSAWQGWGNPGPDTETAYGARRPEEEGEGSRGDVEGSRGAVEGPIGALREL